MKVGTSSDEIKDVSETNHKIYKDILELMEKDSYAYHFGRTGLSRVADYIENLLQKAKDNK